MQRSGMANGSVLAIREELDCKNHVAVITIMIDACMQDVGIDYAQLSAVAVSSGPGSYTSLRTGATVAKGLCFALNIPFIAVDTLQALAWGAQQTTTGPVIHLPMLDARRNEIWLAAYDSDLNCLKKAQPLVLEEASFEAFLSDFREKTFFLISGTGFFKINFENISLYADICTVKNCSAKYLQYFAQQKFQNKQYEVTSLITPLYMKPPNITKSNKKNFANI